MCGGRGFDDCGMMDRVLLQLHRESGIDVIIEGGARGADALAKRWAQSLPLPVMEFPANWEDGVTAGPIRNAAMLEFGKPDLVIAFPGGKGTADMVAKARAAGVEVREIQ